MIIGKSKRGAVSIVMSLFLLFMLTEIVIGGAGRFFTIGPLTFRMLFFAGSCVLFVWALVLGQRVPKNVIKLICAFLIIVLIGAFLGIAKTSPMNLIAEDVRPLTSFLMLGFFSLAIRNPSDIRFVGKIIRNGAVFLGLAYIAIISMLFLGVINFVQFYNYNYKIGEVLFRGDSLFFYKGFLFLGVGFIFSFVKGRFQNNYIAIFLFLCLILTLTRGFVLTTAIIFVIYIYVISTSFRSKFLLTSFIALVIVASLVLAPKIISTINQVPESSERSESDLVRITQIDEVFSDVTIKSAIIGHGFGYGVPVRPIHMEIAFLEIFHKQGVLGLAFWFGILSYYSYVFFRLDRERKELALPFFLSTHFVYLQSFTNPFINNSIGMSVLLLTIVVLEILKESQNRIIYE